MTVLTDGGGWEPMRCAPRDGTLIEIRSAYGAAPWYFLARWTDEIVLLDGTVTKGGSKSWWGPSGQGASDESCLTWRPYNESADAYVDLTAGAQNTPEYWRRAVARNHGLRADFFKTKRSWLTRLFRG